MTDFGFNDRSLCLHMARLAKANQIGATIGFLMGVEQSKRHDVMHRQRLSYLPTAVKAVSVLLLDHYLSNFVPSFAAIGRNASDVTRRIFSQERSRSLETCAATKPCRTILTLEPRLLIKHLLAVFACLPVAELPCRVFVSGRAYLKCIFRSQSYPEFIPTHVWFWSDIQRFSAPKSACAFKRAKARFLDAIWLDRVGSLTFFANNFDCHFGNITHRVACATGSTGVAAINAGKTFTGIEHNPKHFKTAVRRCAAAYEAMIQQDGGEPQCPQR